MAQIGWIDFSPDHRDRVAAVLEMLKPEGMVDELGIGTIRDAFADRMFPGISTIQTRAKYFFIVPYILYQYQLLPIAQQKREIPGKYLERREYEIMWDLAEKYKDEKGSGVIGITKRKPEKIMRRPSAIYWNGLSVFKLINSGGFGVDSFLKSRSELSESITAEPPMGDDSPKDDVDAEYINRFELMLPYDHDWLTSLTLDLTKSEAKLLSDRIRSTGENHLISKFLENKQLFTVFKNSLRFADFAKDSSKSGKLSNEVKHDVILAHDFSELIYGAHCAYNCILQNKKFSSEGFSDEWLEWVTNLRKNMLDYKNFDPEIVVSYVPGLRAHTRQFIFNWWDFVTSAPFSTEIPEQIIADQELNVKGYKARIRQNKFDDVSEGKWIGLSKLEYRMGQVKNIIQDIYSGIEIA